MFILLFIFLNYAVVYYILVQNRPSLHLLTVELRCKLQEKLHRVTGS